MRKRLWQVKINAKAHDVVCDFGRPKVLRPKVGVDARTTDGTKIDIQIFDFPRPLAEGRQQESFQPGAHGDAYIRGRFAIGPRASTVAIEDVPGCGDLAISKSGCRIGPQSRGQEIAEPATYGPKPGNFRRLGVTDRANALAVGDEVEICRALLTRTLEVCLQADNGPVIDLPIVTGLAATNETRQGLGARIACR
jgi:hypothetical protein